MISSNIYRFTFRIFIIVLVFVSAQVLVFGAIHSMSAADNALKAGNYAEAIAQYSIIETSGYSSTPMYLNMAIANKNLGNHAETIVYLQKALKISPGNTVANTMYHQILNENPEIEAKPNSLLVSNLWQNLAGTFLPKTWMWLSIFLLIVGGILIIINYPIFNPRSKYLMSCIALLFVLTTTLGLYRNQQLFNNKIIVITAPQTLLKVGPDTDSPDLEELTPGSVVYFNRKIQGWWRVKTSFGDEGWIMATQGIRI